MDHRKDDQFLEVTG